MQFLNRRLIAPGLDDSASHFHYPMTTDDDEEEVEGHLSFSNEIAELSGSLHDSKRSRHRVGFPCHLLLPHVPQPFTFWEISENYLLEVPSSFLFLIDSPLSIQLRGLVRPT